MFCLNCGKENDHYLCNDCRNCETLRRIHDDIRNFAYYPNKCLNGYVKELGANFPDPKTMINIIPDILEMYNYADVELYYCLYYLTTRQKDKFAVSAESYLEKNDFHAPSYQKIMYSYINNNIPGDFKGAEKWCDLIWETDGLFCDLYYLAAKFYAMIGDYDKADILTDKAMDICDIESAKFIYSNRDRMKSTLEKQRKDTERYRNTKPYLPKSEDDRAIIEQYHNERGIVFKTSPKVTHINQNDFAPINEYYGDIPEEYCSFWCTEVYSPNASKSICEIAAVKVKNDRIVSKFSSLVKPWDSSVSARKSAAKDLGIDEQKLIDAPVVSSVVSEFIEFISSDILVSTDALTTQSNLLIRALRYSGMDHIDNLFLDLLDYAADISEKFDNENNNRQYIFEYFSLKEGKNALEKAECNVMLVKKLKKYSE